MERVRTRTVRVMGSASCINNLDRCRQKQPGEPTIQPTITLAYRTISNRRMVHQRQPMCHTDTSSQHRKLLVTVQLIPTIPMQSLVEQLIGRNQRAGDPVLCEQLLVLAALLDGSG